MSGACSYAPPVQVSEMGFFYTGKKAAVKTVGKVSVDLLHRSGCSLCPLNKIAENKHPHMKPYGSRKPLIYMLGGAPGKTEDRRGRPFVGDAGRVVKFRIPDGWDAHIRWNYCVRTRPPSSRTPADVEIECCRPSIIQDIEETKPEAIFGFGNIPLIWMLRQSGITRWNGRRVPVKVGNHKCWFYPMLDPSDVAHQRRWEPRHLEDYPSDVEFAFAKDMQRALRDVDKGLLPEPFVYSREEALEGVEFVTGANGRKDVLKVLDFIDSCYDEDLVGMDYETPFLRPYMKNSRILTTALATADRAFAWPVRHSGSKWEQKDLDTIEEAFEEFLYTAKCRKVSFSLPFEMEWSGYHYGKKCLRARKWEDAQSQAYVLDERQGALSLDFQCLLNFGLDLKAISNVDRANLDKTPVEQVLRYNGLDAKFHRLLFIVQDDRIRRERLENTYAEQLRRIPTMVLSQLQGLPTNQKNVKHYHDQYSNLLEEIETDIEALPIAKTFKKRTGHSYRPSAEKDVKLAFKLLGKSLEKTDESVLKKIKHPLASLTLEWRKPAKVLSTYIIPCMKGHPRSIIYPDGLIHYVISVTKTRTWRTSSEDPNIQNWPKRDEETKEIRAIVEPGEAYRVVSFDYAGIQARNIAMESRDKFLIKAFWDRYDIHKDWMERISRKCPTWVDGKLLAKDKGIMKAHRHLAKNKFVFPSFFGAQPKSIAANLGLAENKIHDLQDDLWGMFPGVPRWQESLKKQYYSKGYVQGLSGFRRRAPIGFNELINSPIQADEAIIVCDAMSRLSEREEPQYQAYLEIHDDLSFIWHKKDVDRFADVVIDTILNVPYEWAKIVPIEVEMSIGKDWASTEGIGAYASDTWKGSRK